MKQLILLLLFIPLVSFGQTYKVESKKNYDNTTTVKVTKQSDAYENPQIIPVSYTHLTLPTKA